MPAVEQILPSKTELQVFCGPPSKPQVEPRVGGRLLIRQTGDVVQSRIGFEVARQRQKRVELDLVPWAVAFSTFCCGTAPNWQQNSRQVA